MWNEEVAKRFDSTPLKDNWMFTHIFCDESVFRPFIEDLLGHPVGVIMSLQYEKQMDEMFGSRGIRADIYAQDSDKVSYNVEMQVVEQKFLLQRIRYQQARLDQAALTKGMKVDELPKTVIVFICDFDFFGEGYAMYQRLQMWTPSMTPAEDGSSIYILNSKYTDGNVSEDLEDLLQSLSDSPKEVAGGGGLADGIRERFKTLRSLDSERSDFVVYESEYVKEERKKAEESLMLRFARTLSAEDLARGAGISLELARQYVERAKGSSLSNMDIQGV